MTLDGFIGDKEMERIRQMLKNDEQLGNMKDMSEEQILTSSLQESKDLENDAKYLALKYNMRGFILRKDPKLRKELVKWHGEVIKDMWQRVRAHVVKKWRSESKTFLEEFQKIGKEAEKEFPDKVD
jgi:hypothetical protein